MPHANPLPEDSIVDNPVAIIERLFGREFPSEAHFRAWKQGRVPYYSLQALESLRHPQVAFLLATPFFGLLFSMKFFFHATSTGDAIENEAFYNLLCFVMIMSFIAFIGQATHYYVGNKPYRDPERFKDYFTELAKEIDEEHPCYQSWIDPDLENTAQCEQFLKFHLSVYEHLLVADPRAAAYMLTAFNRQFPYVYQPRDVTTPAFQVQQEDDDDDEHVAAAAADLMPMPMLDDTAQRRLFARKIVAKRLGIEDDVLDVNLAKIWQRAQKIMGTPAGTSVRIDEQPGVRPTVAGENAALLAALNQAQQEFFANAGVLFTPMSLDIFDSMLGAAPALPRAPMHLAIPKSLDPLALNLIQGDAGYLAHIDEAGSISYPWQQIAGYATAAEHERQTASISSVRLPHDTYPNSRQDFQKDAVVVMLAGETRRALQRKPAKELTTWLRRFIGHRDPLQLDPGCVDIEAQLRARAHVLAHLFHPGKHYDRWEHWVAHNPRNTQAFLSLTTEHQVWLIVTLLSGAPYARLTASPLIGSLTVQQYNRFMRAYITFMQRYINQENVPASVADIRRMLFVEQLRWLTDLSLPRTRDFFNDHVQKPAAIMHVLTHTLTDQEAMRHQRKLNTVKEENQPAELALSELIALQADLKQKLNTLPSLTQNDLLHATEQQKIDIAAGAVLRDAYISCRWLIARYEAQQHIQRLYNGITNPFLRFEYMQEVNELVEPPQHTAMQEPEQPVEMIHDEPPVLDEHLRQVQMCIVAGYLEHALQPTVQQQLMRIADRARLAAAAQHLVRLLADEQRNRCVDYPLLLHAVALMRQGVPDDKKNQFNLQDPYLSCFMAALIDAALKQVGEQSVYAARAVVRLFLEYRARMQREVLPIDYDRVADAEQYAWLRSAYAQYLELYPQLELNEHIRREYWPRFVASLVMLHHPQVLYAGHQVENCAFQNLVVLAERSLMSRYPRLATNINQQAIITPNLDMLDRCFFYHSYPVAPNANARGYPKITDISATTWLDLLRQLCDAAYHPPADQRLKEYCAKVVHSILSPARLQPTIFTEFSGRLSRILQLFEAVGATTAAQLTVFIRLVGQEDELVLQRLRVAACYALWEGSPAFTMRCFQRRVCADRNRQDALEVKEIMRGTNLNRDRFFAALPLPEKFRDWFFARCDQMIEPDESQPLLEQHLVN